MFIQHHSVQNHHQYSLSSFHPHLFTPFPGLRTQKVIITSSVRDKIGLQPRAILTPLELSGRTCAQTPHTCVCTDYMHTFAELHVRTCVHTPHYPRAHTHMQQVNRGCDFLTWRKVMIASKLSCIPLLSSLSDLSARLEHTSVERSMQD